MGVRSFVMHETELRWRRKLMVLAREFGMTDEERWGYASMMLGRDVTTWSAQTAANHNGLSMEDVALLIAGFNGYFLLQMLWLEELPYRLVREILGEGDHGLHPDSPAGKARLAKV